MSNHFKKERRGIVDATQASGDALYEELKRPLNSHTSGIGSVVGGVV